MGAKKKDPPNTGQGSDLIDESSTPQSGQGEGLLGGQGDAGPSPPDTGQGRDTQLSPQTEQFLREKGLKDPDALVESYKNLESRKTELEKERRLSNISPSFSSNPPPQPSEVQLDDFNIKGDFYSIMSDNQQAGNFLKEYGKHIVKSTLNFVDKRDQEREQRKMLYEVQRLMAQDPQEFERLRPAMVAISQENPNIRDLSVIYEEAKKRSAESRKQGAWETIKTVLGDDVTSEDIDRLKAIISKSKPPKIAGAGAGGSAGGAGLKPPEQMTEEERGNVVIKAILESDKMEDRD